MEKYLEIIENVTAERVYKCLGELFSKKGTLIVMGGNINDVDSLETMEKNLR